VDEVGHTELYVGWYSLLDVPRQARVDLTLVGQDVVPPNGPYV
jgi:hypothetical protein